MSISVISEYVCIDCSSSLVCIIFFCLSLCLATDCHLVAQSCPTVHDPVECSTLGLSVPHDLPEFAQSSCPSNLLLDYKYLKLHIVECL